LVGLGPYLLLDFSAGLIPLNNWVAPNNFDEALNYYFKFLCVAPNLEAVVIACCYLFTARWESYLSFLNPIFLWVSVKSNCLGLYKYKLSQIDDFYDDGNLGCLSRSNKAFNK
jgi:hypothetical protein